MSELNLISFNTRGIRRSAKRRALFRFFHQNYPSHIVVLQETHSSPRDVKYWQAEWGAHIVCGHGVSTSECGVAVLFPRSMAQVCSVTTVHVDEKGRLLVLDLTYESCVIKLFAVYAPTQGDLRQRSEFLQKLQDELSKLPSDEYNYIVMCGDFNVHLGELDIDRRNFRVSQFARSLSGILEDFDLRDVWRDRFPTRRRYTWRQLQCNTIQ